VFQFPCHRFNNGKVAKSLNDKEILIIIRRITLEQCCTNEKQSLVKVAELQLLFNKNLIWTIRKIKRD
jgi:hypothetical protein